MHTGSRSDYLVHYHRLHQQGWHAYGTTSLESFHLHLAGYANVETNVAFLHCNFLDSSLALQPVMFIIRGSCWRACPGGTRHGHWQLHSTKIASYEASTFNWPPRLISIAVLLLHMSMESYQVNKLSKSFLSTRLLSYHHAPTKHNEGNSLV